MANIENPYIKKISQAITMRDLWDNLYANAVEEDNIYLSRMYTYDNKIAIIIHELSELPKARKLINRTYPTWKGVIDSIWSPYSNVVLAAFRDKNHSHGDHIEIWLDTTVEKFPKKLLPDEKCAFQKDEVETRYRLVCPLPNKEN